MLATENDITQYIPQRDPMVMVHKLVEASDNHAITQLLIESTNIFVDDGCFIEPGLVENIAQTAALQVGYQCAQRNVPIPIGYIAAIKNLEIHSLPPIEATIKTSVQVTNKVLELTVVEGKVEYDGKLCCSCEMRIFAKIES